MIRVWWMSLHKIIMTSQSNHIASGELQLLMEGYNLFLLRNEKNYSDIIILRTPPIGSFADCAWVSV